MKPILIICLGNPLMRDEGIGIRLASELVVHLAENPHVEVMDLGTGGLSVMHAIDGREKIIFVDCAIMGQTPGLICRFTPGQVSSKKIRMRYSLHEGDLLNTIELSRRLGECPEDLVIFGIEPKEISDGQGLTSELENNIPQYVQTILKELD
ncbi:MAG: hydrogenase maturation protease [Sedimentisphaerales bacterium]|nr:hydrogenase maturation protease [Sedimentisphaerales bacterium]